MFLGRACITLAMASCSLYAGIITSMIIWLVYILYEQGTQKFTQPFFLGDLLIITWRCRLQIC